MKLSAKYLLLMLCLLLASCLKETEVSQISEDEPYLCRIVPAGEIAAVKALPSSALYVVSVYAADPDAADVAVAESNRYAHGVFDDPQRIYFRMDPDKRYRVQLKAIINGADSVYHDGGVYSLIGRLDNRPHYFAEDDTDAEFYLGTALGATRRIDRDSAEAAPEVDTYFGETYHQPAIFGHEKIASVQMLRCCFGMRLTVEGLAPEDDVLDFSYTVGDETFHASPTYAAPVWNLPKRTFPNLSAVTSDYRLSSTVNLHYATTINGLTYESDVIKDKVIQLGRNKRTNLKARIDRNKVEIFDSSITLTVEDGDLTDSDPVEFTGEIDSSGTE